MATTISTISNLISAFRSLTAKDSLTPESLGYLLQQILDAVALVSANVGSSDGSSTEAVDNEAIIALQQSLNNLRASIGAANGLAPLNSEGVIASRYYDWQAIIDALDISNDNERKAILPFDSFTYVASSINSNASDNIDGRVMFNTANGNFILKTEDGNVYGRWPGCEQYGTSSASGSQPDGSVFFHCLSTDSLYRYSGKTLHKVLDDTDQKAISDSIIALKSLINDYHPSSGVEDPGDDPIDDDRTILYFKMFPEDVDEYMRDYEYPEDMVPLSEEMEDCDFYEIVWSYKYNDFLALWVKPHMGASEDEDTYVCGLARVFPEWQDYYKETTPKTDVLFSRNGTSEIYLYSDETGTLRKRRGPIHESGADNPGGDSDNGSEDAVGRVYLKADESGRYYVDLSEALSALTEQEVADLLENVKSQNQNQ